MKGLQVVNSPYVRILVIRALANALIETYNFETDLRSTKISVVNSTLIVARHEYTYTLRELVNGEILFVTDLLAGETEVIVQNYLPHCRFKIEIPDKHAVSLKSISSHEIFDFFTGMMASEKAYYLDISPIR